MRILTVGVIGSLSMVTLLSGYPGPATTPPGVPESLRPPADQVLAVEAQAAGVQIYECSAGKEDPARWEWVFKSPEAELSDTAGRKIGKHYAGPTWESTDGSTVVGEVNARSDSPDSGAIPWLLLGAKSSSGSGAFSEVKSIQRLQTVGGKAPSAPCGRENGGEVARVPYKAVYYFYVARK
jgi:hypothetical protein